MVGACGAWKDRAPLRIDGIPTPEAVTASLARFNQLHRAPDTVTDRAPKSVGVQSLTLRSHDGDPALDGAARDDLALSRPPPNASSPVTAMTRRSPQLAGTPSLPTSAAAKLRGACVRRTPSPSGPPSGTLEGADSLVRSGRSKNVGIRRVRKDRFRGELREVLEHHQGHGLAQGGVRRDRHDGLVRGR